jgi:hypothetical protein
MGYLRTRRLPSSSPNRCRSGATSAISCSTVSTAASHPASRRNTEQRDRQSTKVSGYA